MIRVLLTFLVGLFWVSVQAADGMASVLFVHGNVHIVRQGQLLIPKVGDFIEEGDQLTTDHNAHIHLKTIDHGFMSLRPNSQLVIEHYQYDTQQPEQTRIKLNLNYGVMRSISGEGAQAGKQHYRLNTPISAIGVRGTDYTVLATAETSKVTVQSGGVVMAIYGEHCAMNSDVQCEGENLFAHQGKAMLAVSLLQAKPQLIMNPPVQQTPDGIQQPLPQEHLKNSHGDKSVERQTDRQGDRADKSEKVAMTNGVSVLNNDVIQQVKEIPPEEAGRKLHWGKWQPIADMPADEVIKQLSSLKLVGFNNVFMLKKDDGLFSMPSKGRADFTLTNAEAYIQKGTDYTTSLPAKVEDARLSVSFDHRTFETQLSVVGQEQSIPFTAKGEVTDSGQFYVTKRQSNGGLMGSLSGYRADQASYMFQTNDARVNNGYTAIGITHWQR